jgi:hypothetical protein
MRFHSLLLSSVPQIYIEHFKKAVERERLTQHSSLIFPLVPPDPLPLFTPPPPYPFPLMIGLLATIIII